MANMVQILNGMFSALSRKPCYYDRPGRPPRQENGKAIGHCKEVNCERLKRRRDVQILRQTSKYALDPKNLGLLITMGL